VSRKTFIQPDGRGAAAGLHLLLCLASTTGTLLVSAAPERGPDLAAGWRGDGSGRFLQATPPADWSERQNVVWRTRVGRGYSSPVVVQERVLITAEPNLLICLNAADGTERWRKVLSATNLPPGEANKIQDRPTSCGYTAPTPVSDGRRVYVVLGTGIVAALDLDGQRLWARFLAQPNHLSYGFSASPLLADGRLLVHLSGLAGLDPATGKVLWEAPEALCSFGTPALVRLNSTLVAVTPLGTVVRVSDGKVLGLGVAKGMGGDEYCVSPIAQDNVVYFVDTKAIAVSLMLREGDRIEAKRLWRQELKGSFIGSPIHHEGLLHTISQNATYFVLDAKTGEKVLEMALELPPAGGNMPDSAAVVYSSPALAGRSLFLGNTAGDVFVLTPGPTYQEIRRNKLPEGSGASPFFQGQRLFLRSGEHLDCIGK
jgi:outer membrane protein assembly factor BamB